MKKSATCLLLIMSFLCVSLMTGMNVTKGYAAASEMENIALEYTVTFDCNGGMYNSTSTTFSQSVLPGGLVAQPDESLMERDNCSFNSWVTSTGKVWQFDEDTVEQNFTLYAKWNWDNSQRIEQWGSGTTGIQNYFSYKYYASTNWGMVSSNSTISVSGFAPIEMGGEDPDPNAPTPDDALFPDSDIETAIKTSGIASSYGGCGPIAMIGILDYFSRYRGFTSIMNDPTDSTDRRLLAYDVFKTTDTIEVPDILSIDDDLLLAQSGMITEENLNQQMAASSGGDKQTLTLPNKYVDAFNTLMKDKYHLDNQIVAHSQGWLLVGLNQKINRIKQSIDEGLPVTLYCGLGGNGDFGNHYVNVYEYQEWQGIDKDGNAISNVVFKARLNWGYGQSYVAYMDSELLKTLFSGVIYYTVKDNNQLIRPIDFADDFVNGNGQGQYFFYEKKTDITTSDGFTFGTSRLRCGYIENEFLVLSANRANAGLAYLAMEFNINVKAINFDISLWSGIEGLGSGDYVKLYYMDENGNWQEHMTFDIYRMSTMKDYPDNLYVEFQEATSGIKFEVYESTPSGDRNSGRVVIGDMNLFY